MLKKWQLRRKLPAWAKLTDEPTRMKWDESDPDAKEPVPFVIEIDGETMYDSYIKMLGAQVVDQYWIEVARRCATEDLHTVLEHAPMHIRIVNAERWKLSKYPAGNTAEAGAGEFRVHYTALCAKVKSRI